MIVSPFCKALSEQSHSKKEPSGGFHFYTKTHKLMGNKHVSQQKKIHGSFFAKVRFSLIRCLIIL